MMKQATSALLFMLLVLPFGGVSAFTFDLPDMGVQNLSAADVSKLVADESGGVFCSGWAETKSRLGAAIREKNDRVADYLGGIAENLEDRRGVRDAKREGLRSEADQARSAGYDALQASAMTEAEKEAVETYEQRVEKALEDRRAAIDTAVSEYRTSIDTLVSKRRTAMESNRAAFQSGVEAAFASVEADCEAGASGATIAKNLKSALGAARAKLEKDRQNALALEQQIRTLAAERKKAVAASVALFRTEFVAANAELKKAFSADEER